MSTSGGTHLVYRFGGFALDTARGAVFEEDTELKLRPQSIAVLEVLLHKGTLPIGEIGERVLRTSGSMTYILDKLAKRGLLRRRPCPDDRRVQFAELTDEGRTLITTVFPEHAVLIADLMSALSPEELRTAADLLKRLGLSVEAATTD